MGKLTRGNLLATVKALKKHPRPKVSTASVAVQAICPRAVQTPSKDTASSIAQRRNLLNPRNLVPYYAPEEYKRFVAQYEAFVQDYIQNKKPKIAAQKVVDATENIPDGSIAADEDN